MVPNLGWKSTYLLSSADGQCPRQWVHYECAYATERSKPRSNHLHTFTCLNSPLFGIFPSQRLIHHILAITNKLASSRPVCYKSMSSSLRFMSIKYFLPTNSRQTLAQAWSCSVCVSFGVWCLFRSRIRAFALLSLMTMVSSSFRYSFKISMNVGCVENEECNMLIHTFEQGKIVTCCRGYLNCLPYRVRLIRRLRHLMLKPIKLYDCVQD